jgi:hypothetical protein
MDGSGELGDLGDACSEVLPCRAEYVCTSGICSEQDETEPDTSDSDGPQTDGSGELGDLGDACSDVLPCRSEYVCASGACATKKKAAVLPRTGIGSALDGTGNGGSVWLKPVALAAGVAAFFASRLRGTTEAKESAD